mmetsp:Transcript_42048/g.127374  ORF Transcript_42048/g.127374 Transcript_42048/m.127374 type:complete len:242 (-) Transcript_42048:44-769(-)
MGRAGGEALRLRHGQEDGLRRAEPAVRLFALLPRARAHLWGHGLHHHHRHLVHGLRHGRAHLGAAHLPWRERRGPVGGDHQGPGHAHARGAHGDEPELHGVQVPADQAAPLAKGLPLAHLPGGHRLHLQAAGLRPQDPSFRPPVLHTRVLRRAPRPENAHQQLQGSTREPLHFFEGGAGADGRGVAGQADPVVGESEGERAQHEGARVGPAWMGLRGGNAWPRACCRPPPAARCRRAPAIP